MSNKAIVLDANILIRAVLGKRVRELIYENVSNVKFFAPDAAYADARKYLPALLKKRGINSSAAMEVLDNLAIIVQPSTSNYMPRCSRKHFNASRFVMPMIGT